MRFRTPSIQPMQSASSTDSGQVMLGLPLPFLWNPTQTSTVPAACCANQSRIFAGVTKKTGFVADGTRGQCFGAFGTALRDFGAMGAGAAVGATFGAPVRLIFTTSTSRPWSGDTLTST